MSTYIDMTDPVNRALVQFIALRGRLNLAINGMKVRNSAPMKEAEALHKKYFGEKAGFRTYKEALGWVTLILKDNGIIKNDKS